MRILVIEDEKHLSEALSHLLSRNNYTVDVAFDGEVGLDCALTKIYDAIILDIMLPKKDGLSVLKSLRENKVSTPVIMLSAKSDIEDKIRGLDLGADDYLAKPFDTGELLARLRALTRRVGDVVVNNTIEFGDIFIDSSNMLLCGNNCEMSLTKKEFEMLEYLVMNKTITVSKEQIIEKLWGYDSQAESNHVEVYISFLRKKLGFVSRKVSISTIRGVGYKITEGV